MSTETKGSNSIPSLDEAMERASQTIARSRELIDRHSLLHGVGMVAFERMEEFAEEALGLDGSPRTD